MPTSAPSRTAVIAAAVVALLANVLLVAVSVVVTARVDAVTREMELLDPVRWDLNRVNHHLSGEMAAVSRYAATRDPRHIEDFRAAAADQETALLALERDTAGLGAGFGERFRDLERAIAAWRGIVDAWLVADEGVSAMHAMSVQEPYPDVIDAVIRFDDEITRFQSQRRGEVRILARLAFWTSAGLVFVALIAGWTVLRLMKQLRDSAIALQREAEERMEALDRERRVRETAESLVRSRDEILGVVSHDLRSPLTAIALSAQMIPGAGDDERDEHVETIQTSARRMQRLIQDLLDVTKIEKNRTLSIRREPVRPDKVVDEVVSAHRPIAVQSRIDLVTRIGGDLPTVSGDHDRLVQALTNILGNAIKFTPEGGTVRLGADHVDGTMRFSVSDTGPGIAESDLPHLFDPFFQSKKTAHLGAGLGLKIARAIVEAHGGSIRVSNQPPRGACFTIDLPIAGEASNEVEGNAS